MPTFDDRLLPPAEDSLWETRATIDPNHQPLEHRKPKFVGGTGPDSIDLPPEIPWWMEDRPTINPDIHPVPDPSSHKPRSSDRVARDNLPPKQIPWTMEGRTTIDPDEPPIMRPGSSETLGDELMNPFEGESIGDGVINPFAGDSIDDDVINPFEELAADLE